MSRIEEIIMKIFGIAFILAILSVQTAEASERIMGEVIDHYAKKVVDVPTTSTVCSEQQVSGDKTADTLMGALIGGIIGNNIKGEENGGAAGAVIGGMIGHNNSDAVGGTRTVCNEVTTYTRTYQEVYTHSIVKFDVDGREYQLKFKK